jgi:prepilin-type N-terminal cleavage/methylation domain-containing protein/prepilin-type processing-associated H-X9-DG protein
MYTQPFLRTSGRAAGRPARRRAGFTLVELLVVIGIIALLISILLPALGTARRAGRSVKCIAALREIGSGFHMYSIEYKGWWPVAVHQGGNTQFPLNASEPEMRWPDLIARFITSAKNPQYDDVYTVRKNSVLWGCPEWAKSQESDDVAFADKVRVGYGMQYYPLSDNSKLAYITTAGTTGRYFKLTEWSKASDRGLIADSVAHVLTTPLTIKSTDTWYPVRPGEAATPTFLIDGARHAPPSVQSHVKEYTTPYTNMLFCDGHVMAVTVREAWNAIRNPGQDKAGP